MVSEGLGADGVREQHPRRGRLRTQWREGGDREVHGGREAGGEVEVALLPPVPYAAQQASWLPLMRILVPTSRPTRSCVASLPCMSRSPSTHTVSSGSTVEFQLWTSRAFMSATEVNAARRALRRARARGRARSADPQ